MSQQRQKLYFDLENGLDLIGHHEGGEEKPTEENPTGEKKAATHGKKVKRDKRTQLDLLPIDYRPIFIRKIYSLFFVAILIQLIYVLKVVKSDKESEIRKFASNYEYFTYALITGIVATLIPVCRKNKPGVFIPTWLGFFFWTLQTASLCLVAGYMATSNTQKFWPRKTVTIDETKHGNKVILAQISAISAVTFVIAFGGYLQEWIDKSDYGNASCCMFLITVAVLFTVIIAAEFLDIASLSLEINMFFTLAFLLFFFMADTQLILGGRYGKISKDEWVFASMKLFADFILIFGLIIQILSD